MEFHLNVVQCINEQLADRFPRITTHNGNLRGVIVTSSH